jgi:glycosyltransferase involved in cell wall biosynthesis
MNDIKFGIIMPTYNRQDFLYRAIESILKNRYKNWIVVVVDDGSDINNKSVIESFKDNRIVYIRLAKNFGVNKARNIALEWLLKSNCEYITLLDDDDVMLPNALDQVADIINDNPSLGWYVFNAINQDGKKITEVDQYKSMYYLSYLIGDNLTGDAPPFIEKKLLINCRFSRKIKNGKEIIFFMSIPSKMHLFDYNVIQRTYYDDGLTSKEKEMIDSSFKWIIKLKKIILKFFIRSLMKIFSPFLISKYLAIFYEKYYQLKVLKQK